LAQRNIFCCSNMCVPGKQWTMIISVFDIFW
jgi:hypothetical protein